jgi:Amt family ammonium transporter
LSALTAQAIGVVAVGVFTMGLSLVVWFIIKQTLGLRVSPEDEARGLDLSEMGMEAYPGDPMHEG